MSKRSVAKKIKPQILGILEISITSASEKDSFNLWDLWSPKTEIKGNWFVRFIWSWCSKNVIDKNQTNQIHPFHFFHQTHVNVYKFFLPWGSPMLIISEYVSGWGWVFAFYSTLYTREHINKWFIDCYGGVELHSTLHQLYILYTTYCLLKGVEM